MNVQERNAPAGRLGSLLATATGTQKAMILIGIPMLALYAPQLAAHMLVAGLLGQQKPEPLEVLRYPFLWFSLDPSAQYGVHGAGGLHWAIALGITGTVGTVIALFLRVFSRRRKDPQLRPGLASDRVVKREMGTKQLVARSKDLRPRTFEQQGPLAPEMLGYLIGRYRDREVWFRSEDPTILIGPSRSGKGLFLLLWWLISAPGAVITTSSKIDNALLTMLARIRLGSRCWLFAPGISNGTHFGHVLRWDFIKGCETEKTLVRRIKSLIPKDSFSGSTSNGGHWDTLGQQLAAHLFHAAACGNFDADKVWEWVMSPARAMEAVRLIRSHPNGLVEHADHLQTVINLPAEQRAAQWGVLPTVLAFMESRDAREWMKPKAGEEFDPIRFVLKKETLYLVGDKSVSASYLRLLDGLLAELDYVSKGLADVSPGGRLDPPLTYLLDEAGNIEYQGLYELITAGGGRGRIAVAVFQSKSQLQQYGGKEAEDVLWDAATAKIVLPGGGNPDKLREISDLIGSTWVERVSHNVGTGAGSGQVSSEKLEIFDLSEIRTLGDPDNKYAIVFYRNLQPVVPRLTAFFEHPEFARFAADARKLTAQARSQSEFAGELDRYLEELGSHAGFSTK